MQIDTSHRSPNSVPRTQPIRLIVLHATVGSYAASLAWLCNPMSGVSTHYLIRKDGYTAQLVPDDEIAWHAGTSQWGRFHNVNDISLGIELENDNSGHDPYPQPQLAALTALSRDILTRYNLTPADIALHRDVAVPAGRKSDPAGFDLAAFRAGLSAPTPDPFAAWGPIGKPEGDARGWAIPKLWLANQAVLGACRMAETYLTSTVSAAVFEHGLVWYSAATHAAQLQVF